MNNTTPAQYIGTDAAALRLGMSPKALRTQCERKARWIDGKLHADLGLAVAVKFGSRWRFVMAPAPGAAAE